MDDDDSYGVASDGLCVEREEGLYGTSHDVIPIISTMMR